ncbi:MAG: hypothetical protein ACYCW6_18930 [Candidatus Xenobia bacterium]
MRRAVLLVVSVGLLFLANGAAWGDAFASRTQLISWGIVPQNFRLMALSGDGTVLVGAEKELDYKQRARGLGYKMRIFRLEGDRVAAVNTIPLPFSIWDQTAVSDDGTQALVIGELGTRILQVDLQDGALHPVMVRSKGVPGFRCAPRICFYDGSRFLMLGYFYDKDGFVGSETLAAVNLTRTGAAAFESILDLARLEHKVAPRYISRTVFSPGEVVYLAPGAGSEEIKVWEGSQATPISHAQAYGGYAVADHRVLYCARLAPARFEVALKDVRSGQTWPVGKANTPYQYPFLSRDGKTLAISLIDLRARSMSMFYAREGDGFRLHPIAPLQQTPAGNFRFAALGNGYAWYDSNGLHMGVLP